MKILPKIYTGLSRYMKKNTVNGKYNRYMDGAFFSGTTAFIHGLSFPEWQPHDMAISVTLITTYFGNFAMALKSRVELMPIIKCAKQIKKAAKCAGHKIW